MEDGREDKMSNYALHARLQKLELVIYRVGVIGFLIRWLIKLFIP